MMTIAEHAMTPHELAFKANTMNDLSRSIDAWDRIAKHTDADLKAAGFYQEKDSVVNVIVTQFGSAWA